MAWLFAPSEQQPTGQGELSGDRRHRDDQQEEVAVVLVVEQETARKAVHQIPETGHYQQDADDAGSVVRPEHEEPKQHQMDTEADQRNGPAVPVRIEEQHRLGIPLTRSQRRCGVSTAHQQHDDGEIQQRDAGHGGVQQPEPGGEQRQVPVHSPEEDVERPSHHCVGDEHGHERDDVAAEQRLGVGDVADCRRGVARLGEPIENIEVGEKGQYADDQVGGPGNSGGLPLGYVGDTTRHLDPSSPAAVAA